MVRDSHGFGASDEVVARVFLQTHKALEVTVFSNEEKDSIRAMTRDVDCETRTAPTTSPPFLIGIALYRVTER